MNSTYKKSLSVTAVSSRITLCDQSQYLTGSWGKNVVVLLYNFYKSIKKIQDTNLKFSRMLDHKIIKENTNGQLI